MAPPNTWETVVYTRNPGYGETESSMYYQVQEEAAGEYADCAFNIRQRRSVCYRFPQRKRRRDNSFGDRFAHSTGTNV
jgi:hypothetical protein